MVVGRVCADPFGEWQRPIDDRQYIAATLFTGAYGNAVPVPEALARPFFIEPDDGAFAKDRRYLRHAELRRFLHDEVHTLATRNSLQQADGERRFGVPLERFGHEQACGFFSGCPNEGAILHAAAVKDPDCGTRLQSEDPSHITRLVTIELDFAARLNFFRDIKTCFRHR